MYITSDGSVKTASITKYLHSIEDEIKEIDNVFGCDIYPIRTVDGKGLLGQKVELHSWSIIPIDIIIKKYSLVPTGVISEDLELHEDPYYKVVYIYLYDY